jgi:hypothetical protein
MSSQTLHDITFHNKFDTSVGLATQSTLILEETFSVCALLASLLDTGAFDEPVYAAIKRQRSF